MISYSDFIMSSKSLCQSDSNAHNFVDGGGGSLNEPRVSSQHAMPFRISDNAKWKQDHPLYNMQLSDLLVLVLRDNGR